MNDVPTSLSARISRAKAALNQYPALFLRLPHPKVPNLTRRAWLRFLLDHSGNSGKTRACREIESAVREIEEPLLIKTKGACTRMITYDVTTKSPPIGTAGYVYDSSYSIVARTKGDAIMQAQKLMAAEFGLTQTQEALVRVEFGS